MRVLFIFCGTVSLIGAAVVMSGVSIGQKGEWNCTTYHPQDEDDDTSDEYCTMSDQLQTQAIDLGLIGIGFQIAAVAVSLGPTRRETPPAAQSFAAPPPAPAAQPYGPATGNPGWGPTQQPPQNRPPGA